MQNNRNFHEQIIAVNEITGLSQFVIEKDLFVTKAIALVCGISNDIYDLVFQGGTSLAKAHRIIERMSEDCDFRIRLKQPEKILARNCYEKNYESFVMI